MDEVMFLMNFNLPGLPSTNINLNNFLLVLTIEGNNCSLKVCSIRWHSPQNPPPTRNNRNFTVWCKHQANCARIVFLCRPNRFNAAFLVDPKWNVQEDKINRVFANCLKQLLIVLKWNNFFLVKSRLFTAHKCVSQKIIFRRWSSSDSSDVIRYFKRNYVLKFCCLVRSFHVHIRWDLGHVLAFYSCFQQPTTFQLKILKPQSHQWSFSLMIKLLNSRVTSWVITMWAWVIDEYLQHCADCLLSALLMSTHANIYDLLVFGR